MSALKPLRASPLRYPPPFSQEFQTVPVFGGSSARADASSSQVRAIAKSGKVPTKPRQILCSLSMAQTEDRDVYTGKKRRHDNAPLAAA
jgi:hypothetical protein